MMILDRIKILIKRAQCRLTYTDKMKEQDRLYQEEKEDTKLLYTLHRQIINEAYTKGLDREEFVIETFDYGDDIATFIFTKIAANAYDASLSPRQSHLRQNLLEHQEIEWVTSSCEQLIEWLERLLIDPHNYPYYGLTDDDLAAQNPFVLTINPQQKHLDHLWNTSKVSKTSMEQSLKALYKSAIRQGFPSNIYLKELNLNPNEAMFYLTTNAIEFTKDIGYRTYVQKEYRIENHFQLKKMLDYLMRELEKQRTIDPLISYRKERELHVNTQLHPNNANS